jgi:hypothetical protein
MNVKIDSVFDREKYYKELHKLEHSRKAPAYVLEAYKDGQVKVINEYYRDKLAKLRKQARKQIKLESSKSLSSFIKLMNISYLTEAETVKDLDFIKAFFKMANLDLVSGNKLPPNASALIKQGIIKDLNLNDLFKKLT